MSHGVYWYTLHTVISFPLENLIPLSKPIWVGILAMGLVGHGDPMASPMQAKAKQSNSKT